MGSVRVAGAVRANSLDRPVRQSIDVLHVDHAALVFPPDVLLYVGRLLRDQLAVGALEPRRLPALVSQVREQATFLPENTRAIAARILAGIVLYESPVKSVALVHGE